jgi:ABC-type dipeptide/oligopeptide/nickel transport system permease component
MRMWTYVIRRLLLVIPIIIGVMTITFVLVSALPQTERFTSYLGQPPRGETYAKTLAPGQGTCPANATNGCPNPYYSYALNKLGLNQGVWVQWGIWMYNSLTFHWGVAGNASNVVLADYPEARGQPVTTVLGWFLPYTLELAALSLAIIMAIGIPLGNLSAVYRNRPVDQASRVMSFSGFALPTFLLGSLVLAGFLIGIGSLNGFHSYFCSGQTTYSDLTGSWPPAYCYANPDVTNLGYPSWLTAGYISHPTGFPTVDALLHGQFWLAAETLLRMILPALIIAYGTIAILLRFVRNSMLEVMNLDFVRTARSKGVPERQVVRRHAGRNSLNVTITVLGLTFAAFVGGFPVIEYLFQLHGVGQLLAYSIIYPVDFGLIFGTTLLFTFLVVGANLIVDLLYAYLDPRVRLG